jgi:uncharacterized membrane-anchored protein YitT (DUF2179 family)
MNDLNSEGGFRKKIVNVLLLSLGVAGNAIGAGIFILPNNFLCGGATGYGRFIAHVTGLPVSYAVAIVSAVLFLLGLIFLGRKFAATIVLGTVLYPLCLYIIERFPALEHLTDDKLISAAFAALFIGGGIGIVIRSGGSTGGSDVVAIILHRKLGMSTALVLNVIDIVALLLQCTFASVNDVLYGILIIIIYTNVMNQVLIMGSSDAHFIVVSDKWSEIKDALVNDAMAGATLLHGQTGYRGREQEVIMCTVRRRNVKKVKDTILAVDPVAFTTMMPATDVSGRGFSLDRYYGRNDYNDYEESLKTL